MIERINSLMIKAKIKKDSLLNSIQEREAGIDQPVIIILIIAVATSVIGAFYLYSKNTLLPNVETELNGRVSDWFDPN